MWMDSHRVPLTAKRQQVAHSTHLLKWKEVLGRSNTAVLVSVVKLTAVTAFRNVKITSIWMWVALASNGISRNKMMKIENPRT
jgi:hypothetical protein